jgi:hypothetical protein
VVSQSCVGRNQKFLSQNEFSLLYTSAEELGKMLSGLRRSLSEDPNETAQRTQSSV